MENKETGGQVEDNDYFRMQLRKLQSDAYPHIALCQHCYCKRIFIESKEHMVCCMCGHRTLVNPISF